MTDQKTPTAEDRLAYVADMLIDLAILLRGGRPAADAYSPAADNDAS